MGLCQPASVGGILTTTAAHSSHSYHGRNREGGNRGLGVRDRSIGEYRGEETADTGVEDRATHCVFWRIAVCG